MSNTQFDQLATIIKNRRSIGFGKMNGQVIPDETVNEILELANWAPTHGRTEPWRFYVYGGEALAQFGKTHSDLYWQHTAEDKRLEESKEKLAHTVDNPSHLVIAVMKRGENVKIPQVEEVAAASIAIQHILLGATALGLASFWSTGGMAHTHALKDHLELGPDDIVMGLIYLGHTDEPAKEGTRKTPISEKVMWQ